MFIGKYIHSLNKSAIPIHRLCIEKAQKSIKESETGKKINLKKKNQMDK